jgi:hypothetical protein
MFNAVQCLLRAVGAIRYNVLYDNSATLLDDKNHGNNHLGNTNTSWSDIGAKLISIKTNSSTTCDSEFDIVCNDGYN